MEASTLSPLPACAGSHAFVEGPIDALTAGTWIDAHAVHDRIGAFELFVGQVRADQIDGRRVTRIEYTTYPEMSEPLLRQIRQEATHVHSLYCLHILHSLGNVPAGGISLLVLAAAPHRHQARAGCQEVVERIKRELPVWGKEWLDGDTHAWKENR